MRIFCFFMELFEKMHVLQTETKKQEEKQNEKTYYCNSIYRGGGSNNSRRKEICKQEINFQPSLLFIFINTPTLLKQREDRTLYRVRSSCFLHLSNYCFLSLSLTQSFPNTLSSVSIMVSVTNECVSRARTSFFVSSK